MVVESNTNPGLFSQGPMLLPAGPNRAGLLFTPQPNSRGTAEITVAVRDNGGTSAGGDDTSQFTFTIVVTKPRPLHNAQIAIDVTGDGNVVAGDAAAVINHINAFGPGPIDMGESGPPYLDTSGDNSISADDALRIINHINAFGSGPVGGGGEGESAGAAADPSLDELLALLALDVAGPKRRRS
jgi:hypothetical protein